MLYNDTVKFELKNGVGSITFHTEAHNALTLDELEQVKLHLDLASINDDVKVVLLKSGGERTFCAGANFNQLISLANVEEAKAFFMGFGNLILAVKNCKKIVVGRIQGRAIGGGVGLTAACDYTIATQHATIRLSELNIGLGPLVIGPMVERKMGLASLGNMSLNPTEWFTAQWAKSRGLFNEVFDTQEQADAYIKHYLNTLISTSTKAKTVIKEMLWEGTSQWTTLLETRAEQSANLLMTAECKEEINKFLQKNKQA